MDRRQALAIVGAAVTAALVLGQEKKGQKKVQCTGPDCNLKPHYREFQKLTFDPSGYYGSTPSVDLPAEMRTRNYAGGSCVHASMINLLKHQGLFEMAEWWRQTYSGGEFSTRMSSRMEAAGLRWASTVDGDVRFLEWCCRTRRGAGISYFYRHAINLVHLDSQRAGLLDNNRPEQYIWVPRSEFVSKWRGYGGWGWTVVYTPPPPMPTL